MSHIVFFVNDSYILYWIYIVFKENDKINFRNYWLYIWIDLMSCEKCKNFESNSFSLYSANTLYQLSPFMKQKLGKLSPMLLILCRW